MSKLVKDGGRAPDDASRADLPNIAETDELVKWADSLRSDGVTLPMAWVVWRDAVRSSNRHALAWHGMASRDASAGNDTLTGASSTWIAYAAMHDALAPYRPQEGTRTAMLRTFAPRTSRFGVRPNSDKMDGLDELLKALDTPGSPVQDGRSKSVKTDKWGAIPTLREPDGWQVWQGEHLDSDGSVIVHKLRGQRNHDKMHEHLAWCTTDGCDKTHKCYKSDHSDWACPEHGDTVKGCKLDAPLETAEKPNTAIRRTVKRRTDKADELREPRGSGIRPEPTDPVMADNRWPIRTTAGSADSGKVLHYGWSVLARGPLSPWIGQPADMDKLREAGYLLKVTNKDGSPIKRTLPERVVSALIVRDARVQDKLPKTVKVGRQRRSAASVDARNARKRAARLVIPADSSGTLATSL